MYNGDAIEFEITCNTYCRLHVKDHTVSVNIHLPLQQALRSHFEQSEGMCLLDRVRDAIDSDPLFEDEIRAIIDETPTIKRDYERVRYLHNISVHKTVVEICSNLFGDVANYRFIIAYTRGLQILFGAI